jgi:hypothetical protein
MPPGFQQGHRHAFIIVVDFPRCEEQAPRNLLDLGVFKPFIPAQWKTCFLTLKFLCDLNLNVSYLGLASIKRKGKFLSGSQVKTLEFLKKNKSALTLKILPCIITQEQGLRAIGLNPND